MGECRYALCVYMCECVRARAHVCVLGVSINYAY